MTAMATTTNSNRKKPAKATSRAAAASKTTKTTKTAKTAKKSAASKAPAKTAKSSRVNLKTKVSSASSKAPLSPLERLRSMHLTSGILYLLFAGLVIGFVKTAASAVTLPLQTRDEFASKNSVVLGGAHEVLYNLEPKYVLAASLVVAAVASLLFATKLRNRYEATLAGRTSGLRWITFGVSSALALAYIYMLAGLTDVWVLKLSAVLIILTTMFSWFAERDNIGAGAPKWLAYILALFTGAVAWLPLVGAFIGTSLYGDERYGWHVYALAAALLLGSIAFAVTQYRMLKRANRNEDYTAVENSYLRTDLLTKFAIVLITLIALQ